MAVLARSPSKYALADLTLRSMIELERASAGLDFEQDVLHDFSSALRESYEENAGPAAFTFIEPSLYEPYERIVREFDPGEQSRVVQIRSYFTALSDDLTQVAGGDAALVGKLIPACTRLHRELVQDINSEGAFDVNDWPIACESAPASLCAS